MKGKNAIFCLSKNDCFPVENTVEKYAKQMKLKGIAMLCRNRISSSIAFKVLKGISESSTYGER